MGEVMVGGDSVEDEVQGVGASCHALRVSGHQKPDQHIECVVFFLQFFALFNIKKNLASGFKTGQHKGENFLFSSLQYLSAPISLAAASLLGLVEMAVTSLPMANNHHC